MLQWSGEDAASDLLLYQPEIDLEQFERMVLFERTRRAANRFVDAEERQRMPIPAPMTLTERFAQVRPAVEYRIENWHVENGHTLLVAQYKTGKTTTVANMVRSLADGDPFLGVAKVRPVPSVVIIDFEMSESQIESWLRDQNIRNTDAVHLVSLRGAASSFDILQPERRREWAAMLRGTGAQFAVLDCLRPAMDALGLDEQSEAGRWLTAFDELLKDANIREALLVHHSGHGGERSRGDSRILDWPDGIWNLVRENKDDLNSARFISAKGRDIDVPEGELRFNPHNRHLTYGLKDRKTAEADRVLLDVVQEISRVTDPMSIREVIAVMQGRHSKGNVAAALKRATDKSRNYLTLVKGRNGAHLHTITVNGHAFLARLAAGYETASTVAGPTDTGVSVSSAVGAPSQQQSKPTAQWFRKQNTANKRASR